MDQLRLNFKLNFFFLKNNNKHNHIYFNTNFKHPKLFTKYLYLSVNYTDDPWLNKNIFKKLVEVDNDMFSKKIFLRKKKMWCKKIFFKKKFFINLLYF